MFATMKDNEPCTTFMDSDVDRLLKHQGNQ
jgi:hypothetical protein